jgi:hypothetical protein
MSRENLAVNNKFGVTLIQILFTQIKINKEHL